MTGTAMKVSQKYGVYGSTMLLFIMVSPALLLF